MYKFFENFKLALQSIWSRKIRSFLTMLGVIIGVFSIVLLIGIGQGVKSQVTSQIQGLGSNILFIIPGSFGEQGSAAAAIGSSTLTEADVESIKGLDNVKAVVPITLVGYPVSNELPQIPNEQIAQNKLDESQAQFNPLMQQGAQMMVFGSTDQIEDVFSGSVSSGQSYGRMFTQSEYDQKARVAVIFSGVKDKLFPNETNQDVLGRSIFIGREEFKIIGIKQAVESGSLTGRNEFSGLVIIPLTTAQEINKSKEIFRIAVSALDAETGQVNTLKQKIKDQLLINHEGVKDFSVLTQDDLLNMLDQIFSVLTTMLGGIAAISLIVGGIGVMNIMLVAVTERTKEIGLRKAVGASAFDILAQFLVEAVLLTFLGGVIGVGLAYIGKTIMEVRFGFTPVIDLNSILMACAFTIVIGVFFGVAPAIRAARLNPIDALKYE